MLGNRQDQLLRKLKTCLGSLKPNKMTPYELQRTKSTYCDSKNQQKVNANIPKGHKPQTNVTNSEERDNISFRRPLAPSNMNLSFTTNFHHSLELKKHDIQTKIERVQDKKKSSRPIKKYEYGLGLGIRLQQRSSKSSFNYSKYLLQNRHSKAQHISQKQNCDKKHSFGRPTRNIDYRKQVEQRKKLIESNTPLCQKQAKVQNVQESIKKQTKSHEKIQHTALIKLNKITQLNEKINHRIQNIINVFENGKS